MDKKKTGNLIREARQCKNYTQSELGRMLGVTNKAVSRWENGESFPDIGVLESLSHLLELPIQDIVTGERAGDREEAVTEVVRLAKLQEQRKREKRILYLIVLGLLIYHCVIGICLFSGRGLFGGRDIACQVAGISMAGTLTMLGLVYRYFGKEEDVKMIPSSQLSRGLGIASLAMLLWSVGIMYLRLRNGPGRKCSHWYGTQLPGTVFEQSALCGLCPECNISGSGNVPSAHGADGTASGMCDLTGGHLFGFLLHRHSGSDGYPEQRLEGTGQRDGTHFAGGSVGNCISVYTVPPFSFSRIR